MVTADPVQGWQDILSHDKLCTLMTASFWHLNTWMGDVSPKLPVPEINIQILLLLSFRLILNMFEAKVNANISCSGVLCEHQEMFKV